MTLKNYLKQAIILRKIVLILLFSIISLPFENKKNHCDKALVFIMLCTNFLLFDDFDVLNFLAPLDFDHKDAFGHTLGQISQYIIHFLFRGY